MPTLNPDQIAAPDPASAAPEPGWKRARLAPSLAEVHRSVEVNGATWFRKLLAFAGPGYLVAVGYMDPGNWATDLAGGSRFGYALLTVILMSNLMAVLLQGLASKLGIVTGRDLAQACRDHYSRRVAFALWVMCEVAIAACDLAEVIGSAIALKLLFGIPIPWGIAHHGARRAGGAVPAEQGIPAAGGAGHRAGGGRGRLLPVRTHHLAARHGRRGARIRPVDSRSSAIRSSSTSPSASSAPR